MAEITGHETFEAVVSYNRQRGQKTVVCRPLVANVPVPKADGCKRTNCPGCGAECWKMPMEPDELPPDAIARCTLCALKMGIS